MTTSATTLVERTRDLLDDYGANQTTLTAAISTTAATTCTVASVTDIAAGDYIQIDYEVMRVTNVATLTLTIERGQRGSTAATHADAAKVISQPLYPSHRMIYMLNAALGKLTKQVSDTTTLDIVEDQFLYAVPSTIDRIWRLEIENSNEADEFFIIRNWEMAQDGYFRIFGRYDSGRDIKVVGTSNFSALTNSGNLDSDFPDDNPNAINYLIYEVAGQLLLQRQAKIAGRDSFVGLTDAFGANYPDQSIRTARQYLAEAERFKQLATKQEDILKVPTAPTQNPSRIYLQQI